ncbi:unnamed protein product [Toxocara canis]|uniref:Uncharacterized protein n=1 Tax=Toxocara canis TaxID=6265 RepID=A0A3P7EXN9_TOXCA|nr:unnamed protein product [Toxocara canis]
MLGETRKKNHFGISREELDCDEQENVGWRVRANVFEGDYDSARPFKEAIWRREAIDLERQLDEQTKRLQQIRLQCSADFDAKLKKHLQDCAAKQSVSPLHGATITVKHEQSALSVLTTFVWPF